MTNIKKKAAAVATVKSLIESNVKNDILINYDTLNNWSRWGKQTIMINRNNAQMRPKQKFTK